MSLSGHAHPLSPSRPWHGPDGTSSGLDESLADDASDSRRLQSDSMRTVGGFTPRMGPTGHPGGSPGFEPLLVPGLQVAGSDGAPSLRQAQRLTYAASMRSTGSYTVNHGLSLNASMDAPAGYEDIGNGGGDYHAFSSALHGALRGSPPLLSPDAVVVRPSPLRWWVLFVFCLLSFNQSLIWVTFSPVTRMTRQYYHISEAQVDLLVNWGPIVNLPLLALTVKIASSTRGVRRLIWATAVAELVACVLRLIPEVVAHETLHPHAIYFLNVAHIINAAAGPTVQVTVSKLSSIWFEAEMRTTSTALLVVANSLGSAVGFLLAPALVPRPDDMGRFLWLQLGLASFSFLCVFPVLPRFYFPEKPRFFPSAAAAQMSDDGGDASLVRLGPDGTPVMLPGFFRSVRLACSDRNFVFLVLSSGLVQGIFGCWVSVLSTVIPWLSESTCGWMSFGMSMTGVVAGIAVGPVTRHPRLKRRLKGIMMALLVASIAFGTAFLLLTPSIFRSEPVIPESPVWLLGLCLALLGGVVGATCPLSFELGVELTFPLYESVSGGAITGINNAASLLFLFVAPQVSGAVMTAIMAATTIVCTMLLLPVRETYLRMDDEQRAMNVTATAVSAAGGCGVERSENETWLATGDSCDAGHLQQESHQAAQEEAMQREFTRIMREVDAGMQPTRTRNTPSGAF